MTLGVGHTERSSIMLLSVLKLEALDPAASEDVRRIEHGRCKNPDEDESVSTFIHGSTRGGQKRVGWWKIMEVGEAAAGVSEV